MWWDSKRDRWYDTQKGFLTYSVLKIPLHSGYIHWGCLQWVVLPVSILNFRAPRWNLALYGGSRWWHVWPPSALQDKVTRVLWDPFHQRLWTCAWSQASVSQRGFTIASIVVTPKAHNCPDTFLWSTFLHLREWTPRWHGTWSLKLCKV